MADKLSWTELRRALAQRAGVSEKDANTFLNALNAQIVEALKQDKQVKINGLGTFRLQQVAPRKSVNVTSGEAITIEGYNKLAFTPEAGVKELIENNRIVPSAEAAPVVAEEVNPLKKLGEQAEEIVDLLADLGQSPQKPKKKKEKVEAKPKPVVAEPKPVKEPEKAEPEPIKEPEPVEAPEPEKKPEPIKEPQPIKIPESLKKPEPVKEPVKAEPKTAEEPKKKKKYHFFRDTLICVIILILLLLGAYFFLRSQLTSWVESLLQPQPTTTELVEPEQTAKPVATDTTGIAEINEAEPADSVKSERDNTETITTPEPENVLYEELITIEPMHEASRLTWMSKRYYGSKAYWPYLYDANRDRISNPNQITVGTPIRVPKLTKTQMDTTIESSRLRLQKLKQEAEAACRR